MFPLPCFSGYCMSTVYLPTDIFGSTLLAHHVSFKHIFHTSNKGNFNKHMQTKESANTM